MKRLLLALCWVLSLTVQGQTYHKLWKAVEEAQTKDLPQTTVAQLALIKEKATKEGHTAQLLKALLTEWQVKQSLSQYDNAKHLAPFRALYATVEAPVPRALWQSVLGCLLLSEPDTALQREGRAMLWESLRQKERLHAARAKTYLPLFNEGKDSKLFKHDLLHVQAQLLAAHSRSLQQAAVGRFFADTLATFYSQKGLHEAALQCRLTALDYQALTQKAQADTLRRLAQTHLHLPHNAHTFLRLIDLELSLRDHRQAYADVTTALQHYRHTPAADALRQRKALLTQPFAQLHIEKDTHYPGDSIALQWTARNLPAFRIEVYRLPCSLEALPDDAWKQGEKLTTLHVAPPVAAPYEELKGHTTLVLPQTGAYALRLVGKDLDASVCHLRLTRLLPHILSTNGKLRLIPLDAKSGAVLRDAHLVEYRWDAARKPTNPRRIAPHADGFFYLTTALARNLAYRFERGDDKAAALQQLHAFSQEWRPHRQQVLLQTFTDRALYRPGQVVQFSGMAYVQKADSLAVCEALPLVATLRDANGEEIGKKNLRTDHFGVVTDSLQLPSTTLPGQFVLTLRQEGGNAASQTLFRVEAYKRPSFTLTLTAPTQTPFLGDTIELKGSARSLTDLPLAHAPVRVQVDQTLFGKHTRLCNDTVLTDAEGQFALRVPTTPSDAMSNPWRGVRFAALAELTAADGETQQSHATWYGRLRQNWCRLTHATLMPLESPEAMRLEGASATLICKGAHRIEWWQNGSCKAREHVVLDTAFVPTAVRALSPGTYQLRVYINGVLVDSLQRQTLFSLQQPEAIGTEPLFYYERALGKDRREVFVGSPASDATLLIDRIDAHGNALQMVPLNGNIYRDTIAYDPSRGEAYTFIYSLGRNGEIHQRSLRVEKPKPEKALRLQWRSFRNLCEAGREEAFSLRLSTPDGKPVEANLLVRLYDAALDAVYKQPWQFSHYFARWAPSAYLRELYHASSGTSAFAKLPNYGDFSLQFTQWNDKLLPPFAPYYGGRIRRLRTPVLYATRANNALLTTAAAPQMAKNEAMAVSNAPADAIDAANSDQEDAIDATALRQDFNETAYFNALLRSDAEGNAVWRVRLPDALTTWQLEVLAHDKSLNYALEDSSIVARKSLMVKAHMPRFAVAGDRLVLPVTLTNLSGKTLSGKARIEWLNAADGSPIKRETKAFTLDSTRHLTFAIETPDKLPALTVRLFAETPDFSDGEQHHLPLVADRQRLVKSIAFALQGAERRLLPLDSLLAAARTDKDAQLTVEITSHPIWYAVGALSELWQKAADGNAIDLATQAYALQVADFVAAHYPKVVDAIQNAPDATLWSERLTRNPALKETLLAETSWGDEAAEEARRSETLRMLFDAPSRQALTASTLDRLHALQLPDGSFPWWRGMQANAWVTSEVAWLLHRSLALAAHDRVKAIALRALPALDAWAKQEVARAKEWERTKKQAYRSGELALKYLCAAQALRPDAPSADAKYLLAHIASDDKPTMYERALRAYTFLRYQCLDEARRHAESLREYLLPQQGMGRSFETARAPWSSEAYRLPTHAFATELFRTLYPDSGQLNADLRLWLLQSRRTVSHVTPQAAADALHALFATTNELNASLHEAAASPVFYTLQVKRAPLALNYGAQMQAAQTLGYFNHTYKGDALQADALMLRQTGRDLAWGSVFVNYTAPAAAQKAYGNGLSLHRYFERWDGTSWQRLKEGERVEKGMRLRQVLTLTADRDYSFVALRAPRAASLEPVRPLSGYQWLRSSGFYRAVRDKRSDFFFDALQRGTHVFTEDYFVSHSGSFRLPAASVQSQYAPEYNARTTAATLLVD